jgi:sulfur carrier protein
MELTLNGEPKQLLDHQSVGDLIAHLGLTGRAVAVEVNKNIVPRKQHTQTTLQEGDVVEVVTLVGGG